MVEEYSNYPDSNNYSNGNNETDYPFYKGNSNDTDMHPFNSVSPLIKSHTYIDPSDVDKDDSEWRCRPSKWKRFELLNRGLHNGKWENAELKRGQDKWYLCRNISCQLGISERLKKKLWKIFQSLDMRSFKKYERESKSDYSIRWEKWDVEHPVIPSSCDGLRKQYVVIFCICALLYNQNKYDDQPGYYPSKECECRRRYGVGCRYVSDLVDEELNDGHELLQQFAEELGFREENIRSCMEKLRKTCPSLEGGKP